MKIASSTSTTHSWASSHGVKTLTFVRVVDEWRFKKPDARMPPAGIGNNK